MKRTSSLCLIALGLGLFGSALASGDVGEADTSPLGARAQKVSLKVSEIAFPDKRLVEIYETDNGVFSYVQSGPYGTIPVPLPDDLAEHGDPIRVFQTLAPGRAIPRALRRAVKRAEAFMATSKPDENHGPEAPEDQADHDDDPEAPEDQTDHAGGQSNAPRLGNRSLNESGGTGQSGCPVWWFNQASVNWQLFCPNQGNAACYKWVYWAYFYDTRGWNGYGAVCSDSGTAIFQTHYHQTVDTFWVDAGTWRFVQYAPFKVCGAWPFGWSCTKQRVFQKFELVNGDAIAHFGARTY